MGACAGDYDNDGLIDLYVTKRRLESPDHNAGRGRSRKYRTPAAPIRACGARAARFSTSIETATCDLFVTNYVDATGQERVLRRHWPTLQ
jgi:hypothetical protein